MRGLSGIHARALGALARLTLMLALAWPRPAAGEDLSPPLSPAARELYEAGLAHYAARRFPAAIEALRAAYALEPRREILFAEAQATRLGGDCKAALPLYERFLATDPPPRQVEASRIAVSRCQSVEANPPASTPPAVPAPAVAPPPVPAAPATRPVAPVGLQSRPPPAPPWYRDPTGAVLAGSAVVSVGVAAGFLVAAGQASDRAEQASNNRDYEAHRDHAQSRLRTGRLLLLGGALLGAGASGRYLWLRWSRGRDGSALAMGGRF